MIGRKRIGENNRGGGKFLHNSKYPEIINYTAIAIISRINGL